MRNNKGFTLVELLVAVAILGIITGMSVPLIRNIQLRNNEKKFLEYGKAMVASAKLYRDSYDDDLFGKKPSGCTVVPLSQLIDKELIKDYPERDITCNYEDTMVRIIKINKQYGYSYQLFCGTSLNHPSFSYASISKKEKQISSKETSFEDFDSAACGSTTTMSIRANPDSGFDKQTSYSIKVLLSSTTGISSTSSPVRIQYAWVKSSEMGMDGEDETSHSFDFNKISNWKQLTFKKIDTESSQQKKLIESSVSAITATSNNISPPTTGAERWYLVLKVVNFKDLTGESYYNEYEVFGEYNVAKKYTLTYDNNGGSGCSSNKKEHLLGKGESKTWGTLCTPERENYSFVGWNTKENGKGDTIKSNTPITSDLKVFAKWQKSKVVIHYQLMSNDVIAPQTTKADGSVTYQWRKGDKDYIERSTDGGNKYSAIQSTIVAGKNQELDLANYNYSHYVNITSSAGYRRAISGKEWICVKGCKKNNQTFSHDKITIADTDDICDTSEGDCSISIKVNWDTTSLAAVPISLDQQSGSGGTSEIYSWNSKWYSVGNPNNNSKTISKVVNPTRAGYTFNGYYTDKKGKGSLTIDPDGYISANASDYKSSSTFFANWDENVCTIKFSPNGGVFNNNANNTTKTLKYTETIDNFWNANGGTYSATRTGYTIPSNKAWVLSDNSKVTFDETSGYKAKQICSSLADYSQTVTLKANWQPKKLVVTFNCNGGSGGGTQTFTYGESGQKFSKTCTKNGYTLAGWSANKNATAKDWNVASGVTDNWINTNYPAKTIYAVWVANVKAITVTYQENSRPHYADNYYGQKYKYYSPYSTPVRSGYTFGGWYTQINCKGTHVDTTTTVTKTTDHTLYACWIPPKPITVTYQENSNRHDVADNYFGKPYKFYYDNDSKAPSKNGNTFNGWYTKTNCQGNKIDRNTTITIDKNHTVYACWKENPTYKITKDCAIDNNGQLYKEITISYPTEGCNGTYSCSYSYTQDNGVNKISKSGTTSKNTVEVPLTYMGDVTATVKKGNTVIASSTYKFTDANTIHRCRIRNGFNNEYLTRSDYDSTKTIQRNVVTYGSYSVGKGLWLLKPGTGRDKAKNCIVDYNCIFSPLIEGNHYYLDIYGHVGDTGDAAIHDGSNVEVYTWETWNNYDWHWKLVNKGNGYFAIKTWAYSSTGAGYCLEEQTTGTRGSNHQVLMGTCNNNNTNQRWRLEPE